MLGFHTSLLSYKKNQILYCTVLMAQISETDNKFFPFGASYAFFISSIYIYIGTFLFCNFIFFLINYYLKSVQIVWILQTS